MNPYYHPYHKYIPKIILKLIDILKYINLLYVFYRNISNKIISILLIFSFILIIYGKNR
jgi:hypothetical protein